LMTYADENEYRLVRDLMSSYDKRIRPSLNHSETLNVTFGLALAQIIDVDEKNQILTTNCWLNQIWTDFSLRWDPAKYGGIKVLRLPYDEVWKPDILLHNYADVSTFVSSISSNLIVSNDGNVTWFSMVIFKSSCSINVRYFPFDAQNCSMQFASWSYDGNQVNLLMNTDRGDTSNFIPNSEWELISLLVDRRTRFLSVCLSVCLSVRSSVRSSRRPLFYIFNMILPCLIITLVALLGFYIPSDSGEKVTMGITTLLSMTVFMMLVTENMPPTSDVLPLVGLYYGVTIFIVSFATAMTVLTLNIHHMGSRGRPVPALIRRICFELLAKLLCRKVDTWEEEHVNLFTPDCNGVSRSSSNYIRLKLSNQEETEMINLELKEMTDLCPPSLVDIPFIDSESYQGNGTLPRKFLGYRPSHANTPSSDPVLQKVYETIERNDVRTAEQDKREGIKLEWQQVAQITDRLLLTCFVCFTLTITGVVLLIPPASVTV
ncbi:unnamed protein product, partial [Candidula unifasciata]